MILSLADKYPSGQFSAKHRNTTCAYNIHDYNQKQLNKFIRSQVIKENYENQETIKTTELNRIERLLILILFVLLSAFILFSLC